MASDGVSDMVHPADRLLSTIDVTATAIAEDAKLRWTVPYFKPITQKAFEKYGPPTRVYEDHLDRIWLGYAYGAYV